MTFDHAHTQLANKNNTVIYGEVQLIQKNTHVQIGGTILGMSLHQYPLIKYPTPQ